MDSDEKRLFEEFPACPALGKGRTARCFRPIASVKGAGNRQSSIAISRIGRAQILGSGLAEQVFEKNGADS